MLVSVKLIIYVNLSERSKLLSIFLSKAFSKIKDNVRFFENTFHLKCCFTFIVNALNVAGVSKHFDTCPFMIPKKPTLLQNQNILGLDIFSSYTVCHLSRPLMNLTIPQGRRAHQ